MPLHVKKSTYLKFESELNSHIKALVKEAKKINMEDKKIGEFLARLFQEEEMPDTNDQIIVREWSALTKLRDETGKGYDADSRYIFNEKFKTVVSEQHGKITGSRIAWDIDDNDYHLERVNEVNEMTKGLFLKFLEKVFGKAPSSSEND